ncbi:hypothetical protein FRC18_004369, partial [Serendipita sp. 400]
CSCGMYMSLVEDFCAIQELLQAVHKELQGSYKTITSNVQAQHKNDTRVRQEQNKDETRVKQGQYKVIYKH